MTFLQTFPQASIVVPAYNATHTLRATLDSLLQQTFTDFEIIVVNDGSTDETVELVKSYHDKRIVLINQANRGLAGARNSGIAAARAEIIGFCDADDLWAPGKLAAHMAHFAAKPQLGLSFSGSVLMDDNGVPLRSIQNPRLTNITAAHIFMRNPIGNGSSPLFRKAALDAIAFRPLHEKSRDWWFDESLRQSEDIECWLRFALTADWLIEGLPGLLTWYRISAHGLSAQTQKQWQSWCKVYDKTADLAPSFVAKHGAAAKAYQLRYLARRAVFSGEGFKALGLIKQSLASSFKPVFAEPIKTSVTVVAALVFAGVEAWVAAKTRLASLPLLQTQQVSL